ncbi:LutC/YkgG family protein [Amaricoccus solimangrovi]|uniref:Lactate utilization protein n=1 Tax=Amaricoccus solimangrovi TaxID=2589815 RepID=A0A501WNU1_9RHOB|nr:LUD domain-containing protein [Amaricoccus solimangrovi]TPE49864.1 lactate utilization protein [Amaricoccus solimangrovi]
MSARERIFSAVRAELSAARDPAQIAGEAAALLAEPDAVRPRLAGATLAESFAIKATALGTTIDRVPALDAVPEAVARYLAGQGLRPSVALDGAPELRGLDWGAVETHSAIAPDEAAGVGLARFGVAESGSIVIHSGPETPILLAFLPLHHVVVLRVADMLAHLEDYAARLEGTEPPRNAILITGPSGTTDIEGSYVRGAHGPGFVHVILVEE